MCAWTPAGEKDMTLVMGELHGKQVLHERKEQVVTLGDIMGDTRFMCIG